MKDILTEKERGTVERVRVAFVGDPLLAIIDRIAPKFETWKPCPLCGMPVVEGNEFRNSLYHPDYDNNCDLAFCYFEKTRWQNRRDQN
jgi:hypothetical protein